MLSLCRHMDLSAALKRAKESFYTEPVTALPGKKDWHRDEPDWYAFLRRDPLPPAAAGTHERLRGISILVTGAGGSIGSALALYLAALKLRSLVLLDASEQALHRLQVKLAEGGFEERITLVLGSVAHTALMDEIFAEHEPQLVFHAAAYKHVALLEAQPLAAIANNAIATRAVAEMASQHRARLVLLSTDKAVAPTSILGAAKRIAELVTIAHDGIVVRLANVLGTEGSAVELFLKQIGDGKPITLTDARAERYFLTVDEAVQLLVGAVSTAPGTMLVPDLAEAHSVRELADFLIARSKSTGMVEFEYTGLRAGEKLRESLWSIHERVVTSVIAGAVKVTSIRGQRTEQFLERELQELELAVAERDLPKCLACIQRIVPDYQPSLVITAQLERSMQEAANK